MSLFEELKRRNVLRVVVLYIVVGWLLMQVADVLFPAMELPNWTIRLVFAMLVIGFPAAIIFSWAFEITPEGLQREKDIDRSTSIAHHTGRKLDYITIGVVIAAVVLAFADRMTREPEVVISEPVAQTDTAQPVETGTERPESSETSIAVLPFVNMSDDPSNEYFSDGISEELLNLLVRIEGLRVPSRTSSFAFKGTNTDMSTIAEKLDVDHVLEGSVRKAGNTVRITAQLIDVSDDRHLWSETYDRDLEDIFAVQDEIANAIVEALKGLLGTVQAAPISHAPPTDNVEAYQLYLRGRHLWRQRGLDKLQTAAKYLEQALELDPEFTRAMSGLAAAYVLIPIYGGGEMEKHESAAMELAQRALESDPLNGEALVILAEMHRGNERFKQAEDYYRRAAEADPFDATISQWYAEFIGSQMGRMEDALSWSQRSYEQDPLSPIINVSLAWSWWLNREYDKALQYMDLALELDYGGDQPFMMRGLTALSQGRYEEAIASFEQAQAIGSPGLERDIAVARALLDPGHRQAALDLLDASGPNFRENSRGFSPTMYYVYLGLPERGVDYLENRIEAGFTFTPGVWSPDAGPIRKNPRFIQIAEKAGWLDYWREYGWPPYCSETDGEITCE